MSDWERGLYNIRQTHEYVYRIVKFDGWFNVVKEYYIYREGRHDSLKCTCPRGLRGGCRHTIVLDIFLKVNRINTGWFYEYETQSWERPIQDPVRQIQQRIAAPTLLELLQKSVSLL